MSLPKKGTRKININGRIFLWHVSTNSENLSLTVQTKESQLLLFSIPFTNVWLRLGLKPEQKENLPENEIKVITPSFVKEIIEFGLLNGGCFKIKISLIE